MSGPKGIRKQQMTHPDSDVLAEFRAGLVTGRRRARISAHLAACERCAGLCDELAEISTVLAAVPAPAMPDAVVRRLEGVLAAEAVQRHDAERTAGDSAPGRAPSPPPRRGWDFRLVALRVLAPTAAAVLLAAGGYGLSRIGASSTSSVAASSEAVPAATSARAGTGAVPSNAPVIRSGGSSAVEAPAKFAVVPSGTNYQKATLAQDLQRELRQHAHVTGSAQQLAPGPVRGCAVLVTKGLVPWTLVLVEKARYQSRPANVIVAVNGVRDKAWVTTPTCSASSPYVLDTTTFAGTLAP